MQERGADKSSSSLRPGCVYSGFSQTPFSCHSGIFASKAVVVSKVVPYPTKGRNWTGIFADASFA